MKTITIPKELVQKDDLVVISLSEYKELSALRNKGSFTLTSTQRKALQRARKNLKDNKLLSYNEFKKKLGIKN